MDMTEHKAALVSMNNAQLHLINSRSEGTPFFIGSERDYMDYVEACGILGNAKMHVKAIITANR